MEIQIPFTGQDILTKLVAYRSFHIHSVSIYNTKNAMQANGLFVKTIIMEY